MVNTELGPARADVIGYHGAKVKGTVHEISIINIFLFNEAIKRAGTVGTERQEYVNTGLEA